MDISWSDLPLDTISNILSYNTQLPTYSHLSRNLYEVGMTNWQKLLGRMDAEYPYWYVPTTYDIIERDDTPSPFYWHIETYMSMAALESDWDVLQVMARLWNRNMRLSEWAIVAARINGRPDLARLIYENSIQKGSNSYIDVYYQSDSWSEKKIREYIGRIRLGSRLPAPRLEFG